MAFYETRGAIRERMEAEWRATRAPLAAAPHPMPKARDAFTRADMRAVALYFVRGGRVTQCPPRTAHAGGTLQRRIGREAERIARQCDTLAARLQRAIDAGDLAQARALLA